MFKSEKGVTLVALAVTIIVLIILSSVSIIMVLGENGIWAQAEYARDVAVNGQKQAEEAMNALVRDTNRVIQNVTR